MRHMGEIVDIANIVLFLASDESKFITRQTIHVSGGVKAFKWTLVLQKKKNCGNGR